MVLIDGRIPIDTPNLNTDRHITRDNMTTATKTKTKAKKSVRRGTVPTTTTKAKRAKPTKHGDGHSAKSAHDTPSISVDTQAGIVLTNPINLEPPESTGTPSGDVPANPIVLAMADLYRRKRIAFKTRQSSLQPMYALARQLMRVGAIEKVSERKAACDKARKMVDAIVGGDDWTEDLEIAQTIREMVASVSLTPTVEKCTATIREMEKNMDEQLQKLPIYEWVKSVRGCGVINVCNVIAVAGDLNDYHRRLGSKAIGAIYRKFGLAEPSSYKMITKYGKTYSAKPRENRAVMWNVGSCLWKQNYDPIPKGMTEAEEEAYEKVPQRYRALFDERKIHYAEKYPNATKLHVQRMAQRKMEKVWLADFYQEWRRVM